MEGQNVSQYNCKILKLHTYTHLWQFKLHTHNDYIKMVYAHNLKYTIARTVHGLADCFAKQQIKVQVVPGLHT